MDELSRRLHAAGRGAVPTRDLWPGIENEMRAPRTPPWRYAAAAVLLFGAGSGTGVVLERGRNNEGPSVLGAPPQGALHAAAAVQHAGSEYVAAVARLRGLGPADAALRLQGYEAALAALSVTAQEVSGAMESEEEALLAVQARSAQAAASRRTADILMGGAE